MASIATVVRPPHKYQSLTDRIKLSVLVNQQGCWLWARRVHKLGYGQITMRVDGKPVTRLAHRVSYETFVGPIPDGLFVDHLCRVRSCVNPDHLEPVTPQENVWRSPIHPAHSRSRGECPNGHVLAEAGAYRIRGYDVCRACNRARSAAYRAKKTLRTAARRAGEQA